MYLLLSKIQNWPRNHQNKGDIKNRLSEISQCIFFRNLFGTTRSSYCFTLLESSSNVDTFSYADCCQTLKIDQDIINTMTTTKMHLSKSIQLISFRNFLGTTCSSNCITLLESSLNVDTFSYADCCQTPKIDQVIIRTAATPKILCVQG